MGRNPKPAEKLRNIRVFFRVDKAQYAAITAAAESWGLEIPEYVRWAAVSHAKTVKK